MTSIDLSDTIFILDGHKFKLYSFIEESSLNGYSIKPEEYFIAKFKLIGELK